MIRVDSVHREYGSGAARSVALAGISLEISAGEFVAVAGPSGSGKTTLLNLIGAIDVPTSGSIAIDGTDLTSLGEDRRAILRLLRIGLIFQQFNLIPVLTAAENVELPLLFRSGLGRVERRRAVDGALERVGLSDKKGRRPAQLSGGEQQRVAVARALAGSPSLVLADEPTANLDHATGAAVIGLMRELNRERGVTFLYATHDPELIRLAARVITLRDGRLGRRGRVKLFWSLALRNVFRNRARTAVALLAIAAGCAALIVNGGVIYNIFRELREDAIHGRHGHVQIYARGYSERHLLEPGRYLIPREDAARAIAAVKALPQVARATRRREFSGMISKGDRYVAFVGIGVEPEDDVVFSRHTTLRAGEGLSSGEPYGVIAGLGLAQKIDGAPGALLTLMTNTDSGALNAVDATLRGIFEGGLKEYDDWTMKAPLPAVEQLILDDRTEQIVLLLDRTESVPAVMADLDALFRREGLDLEAKPWTELALFHNQVVSLFQRELDVIKLIISTIVILGIANTIGMSIVERRVELATLRALGLRPRIIGRLLMTEALLTGLMGGVLGVCLGIVIARAVTAIGIPFPSPPGATRPFLGGVDIVPGIVLFSFVLSVAATLAAALLPVWKAVRRPIAATLRGG